MKKSMLYAGLMTILSATAYAEDSSNLQTPPGSTMQGGVQIAASDSVPTPTIPGEIQTPANGNTQTPANTSIQTPSDSGTKTPPTGTPASATGTDTGTGTGTGTAPDTTPANSTAPAAETTAPVADTTKPAVTPAPTPAATPETKPAATPTAAITPAQPLDCNYRIPAETAHIEQTIVLKWAEKAAEQSFDFDFNSLDKQVTQLRTCYTDQGWQGFNDALQKSGNINAIKTQQLTVSSMVNGESKITEIKDNQWKISIPMQVVYQNDKEKLTQPLTVNLVVGRKTTGDLGIMQMIAIPRQPIGNTGIESTPETTTTQKQ